MTPAEMKSAVLDLFGEEVQDYLTDARLTRLLTDASRYVQSVMRTLDQGWFDKRSTEITVVAGDASFALPTDLLQLKGIWRTDSTRRIPLRILLDSRFVVDAPSYDPELADITATIGPDWQPIVYLRGENAIFLPEETGALSNMTVVVDYTRALPTVDVAGADKDKPYDYVSTSSVNVGSIPEDLHRLMVIHAAQIAMTSKGRSIQDLLILKSEIKNLIPKTMAQRQSFSPPIITASATEPMETA